MFSSSFPCTIPAPRGGFSALFSRLADVIPFSRFYLFMAGSCTWQKCCWGLFFLAISHKKVSKGRRVGNGYDDAYDDGRMHGS
jgi:hypothetical protein